MAGWRAREGGGGVLSMCLSRMEKVFFLPVAFPSRRGCTGLGFLLRTRDKSATGEERWIPLVEIASITPSRLC
jgi:hypothetical protein